MLHSVSFHIMINGKDDLSKVQFSWDMNKQAKRVANLDDGKYYGFVGSLVMQRFIKLPGLNKQKRALVSFKSQ